MDDHANQASAFDGASERSPVRRPVDFATAAGSRLDQGMSLFEQFFRPRLGLRHLLPFLRRASTAIHAGIDVRKLWEMESKRAPSMCRPQFADIYSRVCAGESMTEAMKAQGELFPKMVCELVDVGEKTGRLEQVLNRLTEHYDHMSRLKRNFLIGIAWPAIQLAAATFIVGFLIWFMGEVIPAMGGQAVDIIGFGLVGNAGLIAYLFILAGVVGVFLLAYTAIRRQWLGELPIRLILRIPYLGNTIETMALARLTWTLSMALESGVDAQRSIKLALRSSGMPHFISVTREVDQVIQAGGEFHDALRQTRRFPDEFLNNLETAELSGRLSESMIHLSEEYSQRAETATKILTTLATFAIWGMVATLIIVLIFRLFMFYLGTIQSALNGV